MTERKLGFIVKIKEDDPALAGLTTVILIVFRGLKFGSDPREIGFAPMKYALHFIGQAFHGAGADIGEKDSFRSSTQ